MEMKQFLHEMNGVFSLNFYSTETRNLMSRVSFHFSKKSKTQQDLPVSHVKNIDQQYMEFLQEQLESMEKFNLLVDLDFLMTSSPKGPLVIELHWGDEKITEEVENRSKNMISLRKLLVLSKEFIYTMQSIDFLPKPLLVIKDKQNCMLLQHQLEIQEVLEIFDEIPLQTE